MFTSKRHTKAQILAGLQHVIASKKLANNTYKIEFADGSTAIRLHLTNVAVFNKDGSVTLNSGGWRTITTKERINQYSHARISQLGGIWYTYGVPFYDGITIKDGKVTNPQTVDVAGIEAKKKQITKFVNLITKDNLPQPDMGDCWMCSLRSKDGETLGEFSSHNAEHLWGHIEEGYLHGSLLVNAMRAKGYSDKGIGLYYHMKHVDAFRRALRTYLQKLLLPIQAR